MGKQWAQLCVALTLIAYAFGDTTKSSPSGDFIVFDPEEYGYIERPCDIDDIYCIRRYFAAHGHCQIAKGPVSEIVTRGQSTMYYPAFNMTVVLTNLDITGLNGRIEEFYVNKKTDNLLIAIEFQNLSFRTNAGFFKFNRRGREPIIAVDEVTNTFESIVVTVIIPYLKDLQLAKSEIFTYANSLPVFTVGPGILLFPDPQVQLSIANMIAELPIAARESLLTDANFFGSTYIQENICDFGVIAN